jgi:hypothetical protein
LTILILYLFLLFGAFIFRLQFGIVSTLQLILKICVRMTPAWRYLAISFSSLGCCSIVTQAKILRCPRLIRQLHLWAGVGALVLEDFHKFTYCWSWFCDSSKLRSVSWCISLIGSIISDMCRMVFSYLLCCWSCLCYQGEWGVVCVLSLKLLCLIKSCLNDMLFQGIPHASILIKLDEAYAVSILITWFYFNFSQEIGLSN